MVVVPATSPVTIPVPVDAPEPTVATVVLLLVHKPPPVPLLSVVVTPLLHTVKVPVITPGNGLTVTTVVALQPVPKLYDIVALPATAPVTMPVEPIAAMAELLLLHVPPEGVPLKVVVAPEHTTLVPVTDGVATTVTSRVLVHPVLLAVNVMDDVPDETPATAPRPVPTVATETLLLLHVPLVPVVKVVVVPTHAMANPVIAGGRALTVTMVVLLQPVGNV
jgi:hypothetical protein